MKRTRNLSQMDVLVEIIISPLAHALKRMWKTKRPANQRSVRLVVANRSPMIIDLTGPRPQGRPKSRQRFFQPIKAVRRLARGFLA